MKLVFTTTGTESYPGEEENSVLIHQRQKRKEKKTSKQEKNHTQWTLETN